MRRVILSIFLCFGLIISSNLVAQELVFSHDAHSPNTYLTTINGHKMQAVHEYHQTVYINPGSSIVLHAPSSSKFLTYARWFNYETDSAIQAGRAVYSGGAEYNMNRGVFYRDGANGTNFQITYTLPAGSTGAKVACDQSSYDDAGWGVTHARGTSDTVYLRSYADINAMTNGQTKTILIASVSKTDGYFLGYDGGLRESKYGKTNATVDTLHDAARRIAGARNYEYYFTLTKTNTGFQIRSVKTANRGVGYTATGRCTWSNDPESMTLRPSSKTTGITGLGTGNNVCFSIVKRERNGWRYEDRTYYWNSNTSASGMNFSETGGNNDYSWVFYEVINPYGSETAIVEPTLSQRLVFDIRPASEMAAGVDTCRQGTNNWVEVHRIVAPTGNTLYIGPDYEFMGTVGTCYYPNYYCNSANPHLLSGSGTTWYWNGTRITNANFGHYISVSSNTVGEQTYTLTANYGGTTYQIAKFIVEYMDRQKVGPLQTLQDEATTLSGTYLLVEQDFNYPPTRTKFHNGSTFLNVPLMPDESSYGFYRAGLSPGEHDNSAPRYAQYCFANSSKFFEYAPNRAVLYNHGPHANTAQAIQDTISGYLMYIDGCPRPGSVFSLDLHVSLCSGSKMFFSAYIGDLSSTNGQHSPPNFDFQLIGVEDDGAETALCTYTTGQFGYNSTPDVYYHKAAAWLHVLFPLTIVQEHEYTDYRLKILNKADSEDGNDFVIDDIAVYAQMPPVMPIQALTEPCSDVVKENITTYLRVDYDANDAHFSDCYYQWRHTMYGETVIPAKSWDVDHVTSTEVDYGHVVIPSGTPAASDTVMSFERLDALYQNTDHPLVKYIYEDCGGGDWRYVLYIVQPMPFKSNYRYTSYVVADPNDFSGPVSCGMSSDLVVAGGTRISIDGEIGTESFEVCASRTYIMALEMSYVVQNGASLSPVSVRCMADWLFGDSIFVNENPYLYNGATFREISDAILANHTHSTTAAQMNLLNYLKSQDLLVVAQDSLPIIPMANTLGVLAYTAWAIPGTARDMNGRPQTDLVICELPRTVNFKLPEGSTNMVMVGTKDEVLPGYVSRLPRRIRISDAQKRRGFVKMSVYLAGEVFDDTSYTLANAVMIKSNYPDWESVFGTDFTLESITPNVVTKDIDTIEVAGENLTRLPAGYDYTFVIVKTVWDFSGNECSNGLTYFTLRIVPDVVTWQPSGVSDAWNSDGNWDVFVPLHETNAIITQGQHCIPYPTTHDSLQTVDLEENAQSYISYDLGYEPYTCDSIYIPTQTTLVNQHLVSVYGLSFLDMALPNNKWSMVSFPLRGMFSGDIYIPENELTTPFDTKRIVQEPYTYAADRIEIGNPYQVVFSKMVNQAYGVAINSATWTIPWNELAHYYAPGYGLSVKLDNGTTGTSTLRLPKFNSMYRYYKDENWTDDMMADITRPSDAGKPGYQPTGVKGVNGQSFTLTNAYKGKKFLFGNPTFSYLDVGALLEENDDVVEPIFYLMTSNDSYIANVGTISADGKTHYLLSMGGACFVNAKDSALSIALSVKPDMLTTSNGSVYGGQPSVSPSPARAGRVAKDRRRLHIAASAVGYVSYAAVVESPSAYDAYSTSEDAELMMLDETRTPFAIYTLIDHAALSINQIRALSRIPLCQYTMSQNSVDTVALEFYGDDDYVAEWDLVNTWEGKRWHLKDVKNMRVAIPQDGRRRFYLEHYYEQDEPHEEILDDFQISYYVLDDEVVVFANQDMQNFCIYDVLGKLIYKSSAPTQIVKLWLPAGTYIATTNEVALKIIKQY